MTPLAFTKPCDLTRDVEALAPYYARVDGVLDALEGQHAIRRWEYAMALHAIDAWDLGAAPLAMADIGGAGSRFWKVLRTCLPVPSRPDIDLPPILLIDPNTPARVWAEGDPVQHWREDVEAFAAHGVHGQLDVITAISVIEHVTELRRFFRACHMLLKPGGLLFFTTDFWDSEGPDTAHFHWMRERIYNVDRLKRLLEDLRTLGFKSFGQADWSYPGNQLFDYSVASAAMVKK